MIWISCVFRILYHLSTNARKICKFICTLSITRCVAYRATCVIIDLVMFFCEHNANLLIIGRVTERSMWNIVDLKFALRKQKYDERKKQSVNNYLKYYTEY